MPEYGIDVSSWNSAYDWHAARGNNITYASVKLTQGNYYLSPAAREQVHGARNAGICAGGYHFADHRNGVAANVTTFVDTARELGLLDTGAFLPMLDVEDSPADGISWNASTANTFVSEWIRHLRDTTGVQQVAVYANLSAWRALLRPDEWCDDNVALWLALYNGDPGNTGGYTHPRLALHQHTSQGRVPGIAGDVDRNVTVGPFSLDHLTLGTVTPPPAAGPPPDGDTYTVAPGDTLSGIAARYGLDWRDLARTNALPNPDLIYPGQVLQLRGGAPAPDGATYTVQPGDTLSAIAARAGTTWQHLQQINSIPDANRIYPGQVLRVDGAAPAPAVRTYTVAPGDTLSGIAARYGTTYQALAAANGIANPDLIYPGQILTIP
ncbi:LysM peptidoglycan-binding domain-containing protein [Longimycelium tulufanense]|nr:LysM peptidoglycan-binding domain-containing protein [Longimycelium tulufanense]